MPHQEARVHARFRLKWPVDTSDLHLRLKGTSELSAKLARMLRRALPAGLALVALSADIQGAHAVALAFLLAAIPAAFVLALDCYGDSIAERCSGIRPALAAGGLGLLVLSAALRSPAVVGGVPQVAVSAVVLALLLYGAALLTSSRPRRPVAVGAVEADESYAEAA